MTATRIHSSDVAVVQRAVLRRIGGRAYRGYVPAEIRVPIMRDRVAHIEGKAVAGLALGAAAVSNYLREIGDVDAAVRWDEMASDLQCTSRPSGSFGGADWGKIADDIKRKNPSGFAALGRALRGSQ